MDINSLISSAKNAIFYMEDAEAKKLLKQIAGFIDSQNLKQINPKLLNDLQKLTIYLKIVAFSNLSDQESADILKNHYLESFDIDVSMENRLIGKLFIEPTIPRDNLRKQLKQALLENQQKIGPLTISQWITEFEKNYNIHTRKPSSIVDFVLNNNIARNLDQISQNKLKKILRTYDYLLVSTIPTTEPELSEMLSSINPEEDLSPSNNDYASAFNLMGEINNIASPVDKQNLASIPLSEALEKYPDLGEQLITSNRLKLKSFPEPARPSIKNWLSDYTFNLGFSSHSAMDRGTYLFRNENAKVLNSLDRERLSFILKSYDDNSPVDININTKQVIFPRKENNRTIASQPEIDTRRPTDINNRFPQQSSKPTGFREIYNAQKQADQPQDIFEKTMEFTQPNSYPEKNSSPAKNMNFSSPQRLAYEKEVDLNKNYPVNQRPLAKPVQNFRNNNSVLSGNVVNLKK